MSSLQFLRGFFHLLPCGIPFRSFSVFYYLASSAYDRTITNCFVLISSIIICFMSIISWILVLVILSRLDLSANPFLLLLLTSPFFLLFVKLRYDALDDGVIYFLFIPYVYFDPRVFHSSWKLLFYPYYFVLL